MRRLLLLFLLALATAQGAEQPVLRWGAAGGPPFVFRGPDDKLTGFEYEIITAVARKLGRKPVFVQNDWDGLIPGLGRNLYDVVICGIDITPEKAAQVTFSDPYYFTFEQLVTAKGVESVESLGELSGKSIGTLSNTVAFTMLSQIPGVQVKTYDEEALAYEDVANGRIFGVLIDDPIARYLAAPNPSLQFTGPPFGQVSYGIAMAKGNTALADEINAALAEMTASGELRDILSRWGLWTEMNANILGQPEDPSLPDTEYRTFLENNAGEYTLWDRLSSYALYWPLLLRGAILTLQVSIVGMILAVSFGFTLALMRVFGPWPLRWLAMLYIEIVRGTPLLIQLLIIFYGLPNIGIKLTPFIAGVLGLGLNYAAYEAENYRAGLLAIPKGQMEAALALGMKRWQGLWRVVIPQSFRLVLPPVTNDFISLLKDSSLVSMVTLVDLAGAYKQISSQTFDFFGTGLLIAAIYLLIGLPFVRLARYTEARLAVDQRKPGQKPGLFNLPNFRRHGRLDPTSN